MDAGQSAVKSTYFSIAGNAVLALVKGVTGYFGNSYALIADAIESASDTLSSLLLLIGIKYSIRPADKNHPYGHGRAEPLITFIIVGFLVVSAVIIIVKSIDNIMTPHELPEPYTLIVLTCIIFVKEIFYRVVKKRSNETNSSSLAADAWHHRSDAITSLMAFIGIAIALYFGKGYEAADGWAALAASGFILYNSYLIFRPALGEIMDEHLYEDLVEQIRISALQVEGVIDTEKCFVRKIGMKYHIDLHVIVEGQISVKEGHEIAHSLKKHLQKEIRHISEVLIHVEPDK